MNKRDFANKIKDLLIVREDDGSYVMFARHRIVPDNMGNYNLYDILDNTLIHSFSSLKNAVTYCVFSNNKKLKESKRIIELDDMISGLDAIMLQHKKLLSKTKDVVSKSIYIAKLNEEKIKKRVMSKEINDYILTSKYWQSKKFAENEG